MPMMIIPHYRFDVAMIVCYSIIRKKLNMYLQSYFVILTHFRK